MTLPRSQFAVLQHPDIHREQIKTQANRLTVAGAVRVPSGVGGRNPGPGLGQGLPAVPCRFHGNRPLKRNVYI